MRVLLVNPEFPETYWSLRHMLPLVRRRWLVAPLPLVTVAALLPRHWELRLVDLAVEPLHDEDLLAADVVMLSGMLVQRPSLHAVLARCRRLGVRTVVGGPAVTALPESFEDADHRVLGEGEEIVPELAADLEAGRARRIYRAPRRPDLSLSPVPRFDLLRPDAYHYLAVQFSRGCPFLCEFCDITTLYGRRPRTKSPAQLTAELDAIRATGFRGRVMFVDDNFVGHKPKVKALLPELAAWRERTGADLDFFTEASLDLADDPQLVRAMTDAGFAVVFVGLESPSQDSLRETRKLQNLRGDPIEKVRSLRRQGLDVWGGFILGFDHDGPEIFDAMIEFVNRAGIAYATVGTLMALPNTPLHRRLSSEGRLRPDAVTGDNLALTNVVTRMAIEELAAGTIRVLETLYDPDVYFERCREHLRHWREPEALARPTSLGDLAVLGRSLWHQGLRSPYRRAYWRFLGWVFRHHPRKLPLAIAQACAGHHFIRYTRETAVPNLETALPARARAPREAPSPSCAPVVREARTGARVAAPSLDVGLW